MEKNSLTQLEMALNQGHRIHGKRNAPRPLHLRFRLLQSFIFSTLLLLLLHTRPSHSSPVDSPSSGTASVGARKARRAATDGGVGGIVGVGNGTHIFGGGPSPVDVLGFSEVDGLVGPGGLEELDPFLLTGRNGEVFPSASGGDRGSSGGGRIPDSLGPGQLGGLVEMNTKSPNGGSPAGGDGFGRTILGQAFEDPLTQVIRNNEEERRFASAGEDPLLFGQIDPEGKDEVPVGGIPGPASNPLINTGASPGASAFGASGGKSPFRSARGFIPLTGASGFNAPSVFRRRGGAAAVEEASASRMGKSHGGNGGTVRLIGGEGSHQGSVQVLRNGRWLHVCDDSFGFPEADVICRQLGFAGAAKFTRNDHFRPPDQQARRATEFWPYVVNCTLEDNDFLHCARGVEPDCGASEVAGVVCWQEKDPCRLGAFECGPAGLGNCIPREKVCDGTNDCADKSDEKEDLCGDVGVVRLVDAGVTPRGVSGGGVVYVKRRGVWGTVCDDEFNANSTKVICRSLGFDGGFGLRVDHGIGSGPIHLDDVRCYGTEDSIDHCRGFRWGVNNCVHSEDVGLVCSDPLEVRLTSGTGPDSGVLEVKVSNIWQTVSHLDFDRFDGMVVCRMLGYEVPSPIVNRLSAKTSKTHLPFYWDCEGRELSLGDCYLRTHNTPKRQVAGAVTVTCRPGEPEPFPVMLRSGGESWECGRETNGSDVFVLSLAKIFGGVRQRVLQVPWLVRITIQGDSSFYCNGVLLDPLHVLTAAHCLDGLSPLVLRLHVGEYTRHHADALEEVYYVKNYVSHSEYEYANAFDNDISMMYVHDKDGHGIRFRPHVRPVCLPKESDAFRLMKNCDISGWGYVGPDLEASAYRATTDIQTTSFCVTRKYKRPSITSGMLCAGKNSMTVDTCMGDSGGPLTCQDPEGRSILMGLTSWGKDCEFGLGGFYTRITKYLPWIRRHMTT